MEKVTFKNYQSKFQNLLPSCKISLATKNIFIACSIDSILISYLTARKATNFRGLSILSFAAGLTLGTAFGLMLKDTYQINKLIIFIKSRGRSYKSVVQGLIKAEVFPVKLIRLLNMPHNGCRWRKKRR